MQTLKKITLSILTLLAILQITSNLALLSSIKEANFGLTLISLAILSYIIVKYKTPL